MSIGSRADGGAAVDREGGFVAIMTALMMVVLLMAVAFAVDIARWYAAGERLQRTVDAAALAGVPYLPAYKGRADSTARENLKLNGLSDAEAAAAQVNPDTSKPSRLVVTASSTIPNIFATVLGFNSQVLTRTATADFAADANMGSPCNVMGNMPPASSVPIQVFSEVCPPAPNFWQNIAGPNSPKGNGDRFATRECSSGDSNCDGTKNIDYYGGTTTAGAEVPGQSYYVYKITASQPVTMQVQLFDPMFIEVGDQCEKLIKPASGALPDGTWNVGAEPALSRPNAYVSDAKVRYAWGNTTNTTGPGTFCTGDVRFSGMTAAEASNFTTSFALVNPTATFDPLQSSVICKQSFGGYSGDLTKALVASDPAFNDTVARNFRQWVDMPCSITVTSADVGKDYYLIVRTNVPAAALPSRMLNPVEDDTTTGSGHNRYGIRVNVTGGASRDVAISARERMPIYANLKAGTTNFYLARINSGNRGSVMTVEFFDTGDASDVASIAIKDPDGNAPAGCTPKGDVVPDIRPVADLNTATCTLNNVKNSNGYNGKIQRVQVPIPDTYACDDEDPNDCWYKIDFTYGPGVIANDTTTWSVSLDGDPVRLVK